MDTARVLLVVTSASRMGHSPALTGSWLEEVVAPYYVFLDARCTITIASPHGGNAPIDTTSLLPENATASTRRYDADLETQQKLNATVILSSIDFADYDAVFFAGGHGTMEDFPVNAHVARCVEHFYAIGKPVAAVCHGPACLVNATKPNGAPLIEGHAFTCFTTVEETAIGYETRVPFMLEKRLQEQGGLARGVGPFLPHVVVDTPLITGQNPASSIPVAEAVVHQLRHRLATPHAA